MTLWNDTVKSYPDASLAHNNRGVAYRHQGNLNQAILDYNKAIEINSNYDVAYYNRGVAYRHQGNLNQAILDFNRAIEINPDYAEAYSNLAVAYFEKQEYEKSWEYVHRAQILGYQVKPGFIKQLKEASGR